MACTRRHTQASQAQPEKEQRVRQRTVPLFPAFAVPQAVKGDLRADRCKEVGPMPKRGPGKSWLVVAIRIVLDWRFLLALAVILRVLLNR